MKKVSLLKSALRYPLIYVGLSYLMFYNQNTRKNEPSIYFTKESCVWETIKLFFNFLGSGRVVWEFLLMDRRCSVEKTVWQFFLKLGQKVIELIARKNFFFHFTIYYIHKPSTEFKKRRKASGSSKYKKLKKNGLCVFLAAIVKHSSGHLAVYLCESQDWSL